MHLLRACSWEKTSFWNSMWHVDNHMQIAYFHSGYVVSRCHLGFYIMPWPFIFPVFCRRIQQNSFNLTSCNSEILIISTWEYTIQSLVYISITNIYLEYIGYMFRPINKSSSVTLLYTSSERFVMPSLKLTASQAKIIYQYKNLKTKVKITPTYVLTVLIWQYILTL